jgi:hypothetical protein
LLGGFTAYSNTLPWMDLTQFMYDVHTVMRIYEVKVKVKVKVKKTKLELAHSEVRSS